MIISFNDFTALKETAYLLHMPKNAKWFFESLAEVEKGGGTGQYSFIHEA